jgi:hypothetical protein
LKDSSITSKLLQTKPQFLILIPENTILTSISETPQIKLAFSLRRKLLKMENLLNQSCMQSTKLDMPFTKKMIFSKESHTTEKLTKFVRA